MNQSFHYLIMITNALFQKKVWKEFQQAGLTPGQPKVLDYLNVHNGCIQKEVATGCQIDPATLTGILTRMEAHDLIERRYESNNRRSCYIYLTEEGSEKQKLAETVFQKCESEVLRGLSEQEREQFLTVMVEICKNMIDIEELQ